MIKKNLIILCYHGVIDDKKKVVLKIIQVSIF